MGVGIFQHPKQVIEQHNLAINADSSSSSSIAAAVGFVDQNLEQRMVNYVRANKVLPPRFPDVYGVEFTGDIGFSGGRIANALGEGRQFLQRRLEFR
ncbi:hypothetical protein Vadar_012480 [Vaccinium darrowii]|uniref:Uncharacterized protein n=1 Tax=Vaccinium darrowii TaxID=229202 RepID=A0ACB7YUW5_9ERIC|nr:hypothetical protein Vadar_012480 [Vaccinium darrowii]